MFVRIQVISLIIFLGCVIFQLDLVSEIIVLVKWAESAAIHFRINSNSSPHLMLMSIHCLVFLLFIFQQLKYINSDIIIPLMSIVTSCANLFLYLYYGITSTQSFESMVNCLHESNWQDLPVELQKYFVIMIVNSQRPIRFSWI